MSAGPWKHPPRPHRTTWNYKALTSLGQVSQFIACFLAALFIICLILRAVIGFY